VAESNEPPGAAVTCIDHLSYLLYFAA